ncbi:MAG: hypothetical protein HQM09_18520 [Candidatus Riflebacteria bacterium]|nr:hypothetical protein [Candidatus Riflebacteria bacterium]
MPIMKYSYFFTISRHVTYTRRGFIVFLVLTVMILIGIMAMSFSAMKSSSITQLSKTIDQNRLALIAQAANNEALATFKTEVNHPTSIYFNGCRGDIFNPAKPLPALPLLLFSRVYDDSNPLTNSKAMIDNVPGYEIKLKTKLSVVVTAKIDSVRTRGFIGHLEIISQATDRKKTTVEIKERRDMKLVDLRDFFDKYVLFVKNYSPDYNEPNHNLVINGLAPANFSTGVYSRVYLGNRFHPQTQEAATIGGDRNLPLLFDLSFNETDGNLFLNKILGTGITPTTFSPLNGPAKAVSQGNAFWVVPTPIDFITIPNIQPSELFTHPKIVEVYLKIVQAAQQAIQNTSSSAQSRSTAGAIVSDFGNANGTDYSPCFVFQGILATFRNSWKYHYGFTDAEHYWDLTQPIPPFQTFTNTTHYSGLKTYPSELNTPTSPWNSERVLVGKMLKLFGVNGDRPLMVEGQAFLRFFKIAFLDEFTATWTAVVPANPPTNTTLNFSVEAISLNCVCPASTTQAASFLKTPRAWPAALPCWPGKSKFIAADGLDEPLMSRAIDTIPVNRLLLPEKPLRTILGGTKAAYDANTGVAPDPEQKGSGGVAAKGEAFFPAVDVPTFAYFYKNPAIFKEERITKDATGEDILQLDGKMFIEEGDLHLENVHRFNGQGFIMLGKGNCFIHTMKKTPFNTNNGRHSTLRIYLQAGSFSITGNGDATIEASLIALTYPGDSNNQGKLLPNGKNVSILGNLIVDYLRTYQNNSSIGLPLNGTMTIEHDEDIFNPSDAQRISVGPVRTSYSMNAGNPTF